MSVRCKFKVDTVVKDRTGDTTTVTMSPVFTNNDPKHENSKFWKATPSGSFVMSTVNAAAVAKLEVGKEYFIDITPAPKA